MMFFGIFLSGFAAAAFLASAIFFLKFWRASRDPLFRSFAIAFSLLGLERIVGAVNAAMHGYDPVHVDGIRGYIYLFRLLAFGVLLFGIVKKNMAERR